MSHSPAVPMAVASAVYVRTLGCTPTCAAAAAQPSRCQLVGGQLVARSMQGGSESPVLAVWFQPGLHARAQTARRTVGIQSSSCWQRCHWPPAARADARAVQETTSALTPASSMLEKRELACCQRPPTPQALMAAA